MRENTRCLSEHRLELEDEDAPVSGLAVLPTQPGPGEEGSSRKEGRSQSAWALKLRRSQKAGGWQVPLGTLSSVVKTDP